MTVMVILDNTDNAMMSSKYLKLNHVRIILEKMKKNIKTRDQNNRGLLFSYFISDI